MAQDPFAIVVVLFGVILVSLKITDRFAWAQKVSSVMWILFLSAMASNLGLIPTKAPIYSQLVGFAVPFAVCLILLKVSLSAIRTAGKAMIAAFAIASMGTVIGVLVAGLALEPFLHEAMGELSWKLAGPYTGTYIGGSLNFFALWTGLGIGQPDLFAAANAVDNLTLIPLFAIWTLVPSLLGRRFPVADRWAVSAGDAREEERKKDQPRLIPLEVVALAFVALLVILVSDWIKAGLIDRFLPQVPAILVVTTLALLLGQLRVVNRLEGSWELGNLAFYVFFAAVGAMINVYNAVVLSPILFGYVMIIIAVHMLLIYGTGRLLRMDVAVLTIASAAAKAGPPTVLALTEVKGWKPLALPGVVMALVGYAVGNYIGFAAAYAMKLLIGA